MSVGEVSLNRWVTGAAHFHLMRHVLQQTNRAIVVANRCGWAITLSSLFHVTAIKIGRCEVSWEGKSRSFSVSGASRTASIMAIP